jgi:carbon-monoxide dehydrogenase large subunit
MGASDFSKLPHIGESLRRKEDYRFLTGAGNYTDDIVLARQAHAVFVRSPHAHAKINSIDITAASAMPGVVGIFSGKDVEGKMGGLPCGWLINNPDGSPMKEPPHPILAQGKVRYVGDHVAIVVAETLEQAKNAAEAVVVDYDVLSAVVSVRDAAKAEALHEAAPDNQCFKWVLGDKAAVDAAFAGAAHVTKLDLVNNRLVPNAMEPRAAIGSYNRANDEYTLYVSNQNPHVERLLMTAFVLSLPEHKVRVIAPDVGGGFGSKIYLYAEDVALTWASKQLNRNIKWTADRSEAFLSDAHGRDHVSHAEMAMDANGKFLAMRVHSDVNLGAYLSTFASAVPTILYATLLAGQYTTPQIYVEVDSWFTNTAPVDAYRGAGRPEATYLLERLVSRCGWEMGLSQDEIRKRNFITTFPYQTPVALQYDIGDYHACMDKAQVLADVAGFAARRQASEAKGLKRGIGYSSYIEACGIAPSNIAGALGARAGLFECGEIRVHPTGSVTVFTGSHSHGQGHETTFAQVVAARLGIPVENVDVVHGDTGRVPFGMGTYGSRSISRGWRGHHEGAGQDRDQGQEDRRPPDGSIGCRHRVRQRRVHGQGHRQEDRLRPGGAHGLRAAQLPAGQAGARPERDGLLRPHQLHLPRWHLHLRSRGGPGHGCGQGGPIHGGGRLRHDHQPDDRRGPGARRHRAGPGPGADGKLRLRQGNRPVALRQLHGLHHAAGR